MVGVFNCLKGPGPQAEQNGPGQRVLSSRLSLLWLMLPSSRERGLLWPFPLLALMWKWGLQVILSHTVLLHLGYSDKCVFIYGNKHFRWADSTLLTPEEVCVWVKWIAPSFLFPCRYLRGKGAQRRCISSPAFLGRTNSVTAGARCFRHHWGVFLGPPLRYSWYQQLH